MKIFLDTSSLVKLYHYEKGTLELQELIKGNKVQVIYLSEIAKVEFVSTMWKKVRTKEIPIERASKTIELFNQDVPKYTFISTNNLIMESSQNLLSNYGIDGLRTLDSIQLATASLLREKSDFFFTSDILLNTLFEREGLKTMDIS